MLAIPARVEQVDLGIDKKTYEIQVIAHGLHAVIAPGFGPVYVENLFF
jgi:hypothetical protein